VKNAVVLKTSRESRAAQLAQLMPREKRVFLKTHQAKRALVLQRTAKRAILRVNLATKLAMMSAKQVVQLKVVEKAQLVEPVKKA
jgi:hypothetical protein